MIADTLPAAAAGKPIEVWFQDEARVGQKGGHAYVWARLAKGSVRQSRMDWQGEGPIGSRPPRVRNNRHDSIHLFGAICPERAIGAAIIMPAVNTEAMNEHLIEISAMVANSAHAVLVCDRAGWHQPGGHLCVPSNITLLNLPPYAPELNPMEKVWAYLRANKICDLVWNGYDDILNACKDAWCFLINDPERIISIEYREWAKVIL